MKTLSPRFLVWLLLLLLASSRSDAADRFRTDINPALLYWQAWAEAPTLSDSDQGYLFTNDWRGHKLDQKFGDLIGRYDVAFKLLYRASKSKVACEWGYDLTDGPEALLPGLAKAKVLAQAARLRGLWRLQIGDQDSAIGDLASAFAQGRRLAEDRILISALVQYAIENICINAIAENYHRFSLASLDRFSASIAAGPPSGSVAACIPTEKTSLHGWLLRRIEELGQESTDPAQVVEKSRELLKLLMDSPGERDPAKADRIIVAAGATVPGIIRYVGELAPMYDELQTLMQTPFPEAQTRIKTFDSRVRAHPNLLVQEMFSAMGNCRRKEFTAEVKRSMLQAAIEQRRGGDAAREQVKDPMSQQPFAYQRFLFDGADRGFELKSAFILPGFNGRMVFVDKDGPAFQIVGDHIGKRVE